MVIKVKVTPNAPKSQIVGWLNDILKIKIKALAQKGKANKELIRFLAKEWNISKGSIKIIKGRTSRQKLLEIEKLDASLLPKKPLKLPI